MITDLFLICDITRSDWVTGGFSTVSRIILVKNLKFTNIWQTWSKYLNEDYDLEQLHYYITQDEVRGFRALCDQIEPLINWFVRILRILTIFAKSIRFFVECRFDPVSQQFATNTKIDFFQPLIKVFDYLVWPKSPPPQLPLF